MKVYIGYDNREQDAYQVAESSLRRHASIPVEVTPLCSDQLRMQGLLRRPVDARGGLYDLHSQASQATEFAISRFLVPMIAQSGWALFFDCDMVIMADVAELLTLADPSKAAQVIKSTHSADETIKMRGATQTNYARKNWSSVCLWNASHPANQRLTIDAINFWPGRELHAFCWLHDSEIGELPPEWNWLVGVQPKPYNPKIAHFTLGIPLIPGYENSEHADIWLNEYQRSKQ